MQPIKCISTHSLLIFVASADMRIDSGSGGWAPTQGFRRGGGSCTGRV